VSSVLALGRIGFGCYRVDDETPGHREALERALDAGCTLIDTSTNYTDGGSERLVGAVLHDLRQRDARRRDRIVVVSKIGYVQGRNLEVAVERERAGRPFPDMVRYADGCWHCIHPEFLEDQLARSLERLRSESLDVCLLHNPEYFLSNAAKGQAKGDRDGGLEAIRDEFYRRLREAFAFLEDRVRAGVIRHYGVSSNTAVVPASDPEATSLSRMLEAARAAGGEAHHFRVLQVPMNLFESGAALTPNTGRGAGQTAVEAASEAGLAVLLNRPLNAFVGGRLLRLAEVPVPPREARLEDVVAGLRALEQEHATRFAADLPADGREAASQLFQLTGQVSGLADQIDDHVHWEQIAGQYFIPRVNMLVSSLARSLPPGRGDEWRAWWDRCVPLIGGLIREVGRGAALKSQGPARSIAAQLDPLLPKARRQETLSRKALWVLASTPGVSSVLLGMRRTEYVEDAMPVFDWERLGDPLEVLRGFRATGA
jgi:aryl-alcohol dehydrogenase-like predicted oxidoreductase